ncbi:hypothetical protein F4804DRAFT_121024 [Jackrogersella minutella]|nr:hypothetical protein F4804DRAFT_121024 [Jackrogersella minutella]
MPSFRGIEISIIASSGVRKLPEYPHPDGSSVRLTRVGVGLKDLRNGGRISPHPFAVSSFSDADPTRQKKVNPRISVYIPSSPGDQFRLRYLVSQSSPPSRFLFFKMSVNGHHTVSWGIDAGSCSAGSVTRSLYEPSERFRDKNGDPVVGIETRYFHFARDVNKKSVAEDGGLIEVQVFRCRGRKRISVVLDPCPHRHRDRYGITSSSGGLVDDPQDATFYEYHLEDARDSPYATFCFHYRSMNHLEQLSLIPQQEVRHRLVSNNPSSTSVSDSQPDTAYATSSPDKRVFDGDLGPVGIALSEPSETPRQGEYFLRSPPPLSPTRSTSITIGDAEQARRDEAMAEILQRPLPGLPRTLSRQSSIDSGRSSCPSLTPSLKRYVDSEEFENEEIRLYTAQPIFMPSAEPTKAFKFNQMNTHDQEGDSISDYATSLNSTEASHSPQLPSPEGYLPTTGSVLERQLHQFDSPANRSPPKAKSKLPEAVLTSDGQPRRTSTIKLSEAEWLRRSPSPQRRKGNLMKRLWSPQLKKHPGRSSMVELSARKGEAMDPGCPDDETPTRDSRVAGDTEDTNEIPAGNWI